jgi:flagellar biosynthesis/type III secretory pathway M-ring protein FliF/YscJ
MRIAKQDAVARAIRKRPGIEDANVIYDVTKPGGFSEKVAKAIAYVKPVGSTQLDEAMVIDIRLDVVGAYAELKPENVTVSDLNGHTWRGSVGSADEIKYASLKHSHEEEIRTKPSRVAEIPATRPSDPAVDWNAWSQGAWNWAVRSWKTLAGIGFALVCLLVLRSMVWAKPAETDEPAITTVFETAADAAPAKTAKVAPPHWRRDTGVADRPLREELSELVEEDPETAANILRNWIGQVS